MRLRVLCHTHVYAKSGIMYKPEAMGTAAGAREAARLAGIAVDGRLVVYAGAGISMADPTRLPSGAEIAERCHRKLADELDSAALDAADSSDLASVADAVADGGSPEDVEHVRRTAVGVAGFTTAAPGFGHEVLALLMLESIVEVITTNWDDCIERAGGEERILAVQSDQDRAQVTQQALLKVHGCATRPSGILITSDDLSDPPAWARDAVNERLASCSVVFVGIGDIAGYVRKRVEEAVERVGAGRNVYVVGPGIVAGWDSTHWADVLPDLSDERRVEASADEFLDQLAGACIRRNLGDISERLADAEAERTAFDISRSALEHRTSLEGLRWLRRCAFQRSPGKSATQEQAFTSAMIALGMLGKEAAENGDPDLAIPPVRSSRHVGARAVIGQLAYEVLVAIGPVTGSKFQRESASRLQRLRSEGDDPSDDPVFLIAGAVGRAGRCGASLGCVDVWFAGMVWGWS